MIPRGVVEIRKELCSECAGKAHDPCASCEHGKWGQYETTGCDDPNRKIEGLGDIVASVAQPIARGIDAVLGTNIQNCGGCKKRQQTLNEKFPLK
jgi:hypothetical protein